MNTLLVAFALLSFSGLNLADDECSKDVEEVLDECSTKIFDPNTLFPDSVQELSHQCTALSEAGECLRNYTYKCLDDNSRLIGGLLLSGAILTGRDTFCGTQRQKEAFLSHSKCMNATASLEESCRNAFVQVLKVAKYSKPEMKIPISCCYYHQFTECMGNALKEAGTEACPPSSVEYFTEMQATFKAQTIDMMCGSCYEKESSKCEKITGKSFSGRGPLMKYLINVFANKKA